MEAFDPDDMPLWLRDLWPSSDRERKVVAGIDDDDCAVLKIGQELVILTTDYLNANPIGVQLGLASPRDLGRLVVAANLSDLCGTGARPQAMLIAITMPRNSSVEEFQEIMLGVHDESVRWSVPVVGGDTKIGKARALLGVAIGSASSEDELFLRNRARPGDEIWLSGKVGSCSAATLGLSRSFGDDPWRRWARSAILEPDLPLRKSRILSGLRIAHGGADLSDGIGAALEAICRVSNVGVILDCQSLPLEAETVALATSLRVPAWAFALAGGGDFQFLVTIPQGEGATMRELGFHHCGIITQEQTRLLQFADREEEVELRGHRDARNLTFAEEILVLVEAFRKWHSE